MNRLPFALQTDTENVRRNEVRSRKRLKMVEEDKQQPETSEAKPDVPLGEDGKPLSKNQLKKLAKGKVRMF
jgi:hypothetical protein